MHLSRYPRVQFAHLTSSLEPMNRHTGASQGLFGYRKVFDFEDDS